MKNGGQAQARPVVGGEPCPGCGPHAAGGYGSAFVLVVLLVLFARAVPVWAAPPQITSETAFTVDEGSTAVTTLTATDPENDPLTWSIPTGGGADADAFSLTAAGGLTFTAAPDYEASTDDDEDNVYAVTVEVSDGTDSTPAALEVTVEDVAPGLAGPTTARHPEGKRGLRIAAYSVDDDVTWSLTGDDAAQFTIAGGFLRFVDPPDYENAADADTDNVYNVTVQADDGTATEMTGVAVTVTNIDEPGVVTLSTPNPRLDTALTATLADPDTMSGTPTWLWERSTGPNAWVVITAATSSQLFTCGRRHRTLPAGHRNLQGRLRNRPKRRGRGAQRRASPPAPLSRHKDASLDASLSELPSGHPPLRRPVWSICQRQYGPGYADPALGCVRCRYPVGG